MTMKFLVQYKYINKRTGNVASTGGVNVEAKDRYEAEGKALAELKRHPRVQGTDGYNIELKI